MKVSISQHACFLPLYIDGLQEAFWINSNLDIIIISVEVRGIICAQSPLA